MTKQESEKKGKGKKGADKKKDDVKDTNEAPVHMIKSGFSLVHEVDHYPGLFKNDKSEMFDLRPNTSEIIKPSLQTFHNMDKKKL